MTTFRSSFVPLVAAAAVFVAGCGSSATAAQRVERCLDKQPDATKSECSKWEKDGKLSDDGMHKGHKG